MSDCTFLKLIFTQTRAPSKPFFILAHPITRSLMLSSLGIANSIKWHKDLLNARTTFKNLLKTFLENFYGNCWILHSLWTRLYASIVKTEQENISFEAWDCEDLCACLCLWFMLHEPAQMRNESRKFNLEQHPLLLWKGWNIGIDYLEHLPKSPCLPQGRRI